jgi:hypothetical protein
VAFELVWEEYLRLDEAFIAFGDLVKGDEELDLARDDHRIASYKMYTYIHTYTEMYGKRDNHMISLLLHKAL